MANERDVERALSVSALNRSEIPQLAIGEDDTARVLFSPGGDQATQGAPGSFYSALWLNGAVGGLEGKVSDGGALSWTAGAGMGPGPSRWPVTTRFNNPTARVAAKTSLVLWGPGNNFAEFFASYSAAVPRPGFQLCDSNGVGWIFTLNAANTAIASQASVTLAAQQASLTNPAWFRQDGRTIVGSGRGHGGSLQVKSYAGGIQCRWAGLATYITMMSPNGSFWNVQPNTSGTLTVSAGSP